PVHGAFRARGELTVRVPGTVPGIQLPGAAAVRGVQEPLGRVAGPVGQADAGRTETAAPGSFGRGCVGGGGHRVLLWHEHPVTPGAGRGARPPARPAAR